MPGKAVIRKAWLILCLVVFAASFTYAASRGITAPFRNWDMVAYVGSAISWQESDPDVIYNSTLADVKEVVWPELYEDIATKNALSKDRDAFLQQLPWYTIKPLYVGSMVVLHHVFGMGYSQATFVISTASFVLLGALLALWRPSRLNRGVWLLLMMAMVFVGNRPMEDLARYSTPDALSTLLIIAAFFYLVYRPKFEAFAAFAAAAILVRPDSVILMILACAAWFFGSTDRSRPALKKAGIAVLGFAALYVGVKWAMGGYDWSKLFYYAFVNKSPYPATMEYELTLAKYLEVLFGGLAHIFSDVRLFPMLVLSAAALFCHFMYPVANRRWLFLLLAVWAAFAARFVLFPAWWEYRYYYAYYLLALAACAEMIPPYAGLLWQRLLAHRAAINPQ